MRSEGDSETRIMAGLLEAVERDGQVSQRRLAGELGIALGLVNAYLKRCVRKGLVKMRQAPARRYMYYVTPKGLSEKTRLTAAYLSYSLTFFRQSRESCSEMFAAAKLNNWRRVALIGAGDLTEVAILCAIEQGIEIVAVVDADWPSETFIGRPVVKKLADLPKAAHGLVVTSLERSQAVYDELVRQVGVERVMVPGAVGVITLSSGMGDAA